MAWSGLRQADIDYIRKDVEMTFSPMLAVSAPATDATIKRLQGTHFFETKIDGVRALMAINKGTVRITNRNGVDTTYRYPELVSAALQKFGTDAQLILDGEVTVLDSDGHPSFKLTSKRDRQQKRAIIEALSTSMPVTFIVFDLLYRASGPSMDRRSLPWQDRHAELLDVFNTTPANKHIRVNAGGTDGEQMMALVREYKLEGLVAKEVTSPYQSGRRSQWIKIKPTITGSFLVTGTTEGTGSRQATFGALSLAVVREDGSLLPVGEVGSGFKQADLTEVLDMLSGGADLIVEVEYMEYTVDGSLRFPVFRGIRSDVTRLDCSVDQLS